MGGTRLSNRIAVLFYHPIGGRVASGARGSRADRQRRPATFGTVPEGRGRLNPASQRPVPSGISAVSRSSWNTENGLPSQITLTSPEGAACPSTSTMACAGMSTRIVVGLLSVLPGCSSSRTALTGLRSLQRSNEPGISDRRGVHQRTQNSIPDHMYSRNQLGRGIGCAVGPPLSRTSRTSCPSFMNSMRSSGF